MQAHAAINTRTLTNKCHTNTHITRSGTRTHAFYSSALIARELPAVGDLWGNRTPPVPLSSPHEPKETLRPTGATSIYSLIPELNCSLSSVFSSTIYPTSLLFLPIAPSARLISKHQIPCNYFKSHQGLFFLFWRESNLHIVPGVLLVVMQPDEF